VGRLTQAVFLGSFDDTQKPGRACCMQFLTISDKTLSPLAVHTASSGFSQELESLLIMFHSRVWTSLRSVISLVQALIPNSVSYLLDFFG
jgi:hypothetical protein